MLLAAYHMVLRQHGGGEASAAAVSSNSGTAAVWVDATARANPSAADGSGVVLAALAAAHREGRSSSSSSSADASDGQCQATTRTGARCSRRAADGAAFCRQHAKQAMASGSGNEGGSSSGSGGGGGGGDQLVERVVPLPAWVFQKSLELAAFQPSMPPQYRATPVIKVLNVMQLGVIASDQLVHVGVGRTGRGCGCSTVPYMWGLRHL